ncbi:MAG: aldehyde dehydrogenase family protein [Candidatus Aenigmarchaeota archaeon]|nr:aldehyde dehydrogenase family protein [Candidatus Aenigmarchaeota archaeon]
MGRLNSINPADGSVVGSVKISTKSDVANAFKKAKKIFPLWSRTPLEERIEYIDKFAEEIQKQKEELAKIITLEMGKPYKEALGEVAGCRETIRYYTKKGPDILQEEIISKENAGERKIVFEPWGVCGVITPWNYPISLPINKIISNILVGNTVLFKPSEYTPLCGQKIVEIFKKVGLPEGVVNVVFGDGKVGKMVVDTPVNFICFTGSSKVGQEIYQKCGRKFIKCVLELGGSSPALVFADTDLNSAVENLYWARFSNCGQVCCAVKRVFVEDSIFHPFLERMIEKVSQKKIGDPFTDVDFGPLVSKKQLDLLVSQVKDAIQKGAKVEIGGKRPEGREYRKGNFFLPTILTNVNFKMRVLKEEVFGPVLPIMPFKNIGEAIKMANKTQYGLSAEIYTSDPKKAEELTKDLQAGVVAINTHSFFSREAPFGGYKKSGIGREGGKYGLRELVQIKYICRE